ncbi:MAG TPA: glycosyltransferase family A protein [Candidatus Tumulicola sp.]|jgi:glycosyltransferase involved in cell wall biosynthesis
MRATIQFCTYNRAMLLERVLDACFEQTVPEDAYEVVVVNDGSSDETSAVLHRMAARARCAYEIIEQPNGGLAKARNAGIARAKGERIIFIDDDVLVLPNFVAEHLRSAETHPADVVRGGAIAVESFDDLPPPVWSLKHYSGNFFWTTNVSVPLETLRAAGAFNESFGEYGWEDIDVGLRLRARGVRATFNPNALVYHWKPRPVIAAVDSMIRQARAQARTAVLLAKLHPQWRSYLATGINPMQRAWHRTTASPQRARQRREMFENQSPDRPMTDAELRAARWLAGAAYFAELESALRAGA